MKLLYLTAENFRGLPNGTYSFASSAGAPVERVFITGPAASGKTSLLEAIIALKESVGAYGAALDRRRLLRDGASSGRLEGTWLLSGAEADAAKLSERKLTSSLVLQNDGPPPLAEPAVRGLFAEYDCDPSRGKFEYFPANRNLQGLGPKALTPAAAEARLRLSDNVMKYAMTKRALIDLAVADGLHALEESAARGVLLKIQQRDSLARYKSDLAAILPNLRLLGVVSTGEGPDLCFERRDGSRLSLAELSTSEQQGLLFAATFRRLGLSHSIVLIDQPELYLHPDEQLRFIRALDALGTDNQIFFATSSADVMRLASAHEVVRLGPAPTGGRAAR